MMKQTTFMRTDRRPTGTMQGKRSQWAALWDEIIEIMGAGGTSAVMVTTNARGRHRERLQESAHFGRGRTNRRRIAEWNIEDFNTRVGIIGATTHAPAWEVRTTSDSSKAMAVHEALLAAIEGATARLARRGGAKGLWIAPEPLARAERAADLANAISIREPEAEPTPAPQGTTPRRPRNALALTLAAGIAVAAAGAERPLRRNLAED